MTQGYLCRKHGQQTVLDGRKKCGIKGTNEYETASALIAVVIR